MAREKPCTEPLNRHRKIRQSGELLLSFDRSCHSREKCCTTSYGTIRSVSEVHVSTIIQTFQHPLMLTPDQQMTASASGRLPFWHDGYEQIGSKQATWASLTDLLWSIRQQALPNPDPVSNDLRPQTMGELQITEPDCSASPQPWKRIIRHVDIGEVQNKLPV